MSKKRFIGTLMLRGALLLALLVPLQVACTQEPAAPTIQVSPASVPIGGKVTVSGKGFAPGASITVLADTILLGRGAVAILMAKAQADSQGAFDEEVAIPPPFAPGIPPKFAPATYNVRATDDKIVVTTSFTVLEAQAPPPGGPPQGAR